METKPNCRAPTACCLCTSSSRSVRWQIFSSSTGLEITRKQDHFGVFLLNYISNLPRICRSDTERISHQMVKTGVFQQALSRLFHLLWISRTLPDECLKSRLYQISESIAKAAQFITYNDQHLSWFQRKKCALPQSQPTDATNSIMLWQDDLSCRFIQKHRELEGLSSTQASQPCTNKNTSNFWP